MLNERAHKQKEFILNVCEIENDFIAELHNSREKLTDRYRFGDLEEKYLKIVEEIYVRRNSKCMIGKDAEEFCRRLEEYDEKGHN
jgi:hypothetical protein